jgi:hypothetical protein
MHWARRAASRAAWTAGKSNAISTAMIAITTNSSIKVKPQHRFMTKDPPDKRRPVEDRPFVSKRRARAFLRSNSLPDHNFRLWAFRLSRR